MHDNGDDRFINFMTNADFLQKAQKIIYEGEEAFLVRSKPFYVIKTKDSVVCGALHNRFEYISS